MRSREEIQGLFQMARENDCPWIEVDGVKFPVPKIKIEAAPSEPESPEIAGGPGAEYTDEEILFYSTPYFDEIQSDKNAKKKHAEEERQFRSTT